MSDITRIETGSRMSQAVLHGDLVFLSGQCGTAGTAVAEQTAEALLKIECLLAKAGSSKSRILSTTIWLADIAHYDAVNVIWDAWVPEGCAPARSCGEMRLGGTGYDVEIICIAAR